MRKILMIILLCTSTMCYSNTKNDSVKVNNEIEQKTVHPQNEWELIKKAIILQESRGNEKAVSRDGKSCGILQITPICVKDCNLIMKRLKSSKRYTLKDRFNKEKSFEMYEIIQNNYNPKRDKETAIRLWNGGCNFSKTKTNGYYKSVLKKYNMLKEDKN